MTAALAHAALRRKDPSAWTGSGRVAPAPGLTARTAGVQRCTCGGGCPGCRAQAAGSALRVNAPGDAWEREAERMADAVLSGAPAAVGGTPAPPALRRCSCGGSCPSCRAKADEESETLHRGDAGAGSAPAFAPPVVHDVLGSAGRPLEAGTRGLMESRFDADFGGVRIHTDARAAESAREVDAHAYTVGSDVVFAAGRYAPGTPRGDRLLAHELAHVMQQGGSPAPPTLRRHSCRSGEGPPATEPAAPGEAGPHPLVYRGISPGRSRRPAVGDAQELLNRFLDQLRVGNAPCGAGADLPAIARLRARLSQDPLDVDCRFGPDTEAATKMFQRCVFPAQPAEWDGKIGPKTWAEMVKLRVAPAPSPAGPAAPAAPSTPAAPAVFKIVGKSYIAPIGSSVGTAPCLAFPAILPVPGTLPPFGIGPLVGTTPQQRLALFAAATDLGFSEAPRTDAKDKGYRLYSERTFRVGCNGSGGVGLATATPVDTDAGMEGPFQAPPLVVERSTFALSGSRVKFLWKVKGRPHPAVEPSFQLICFRTSFFIWHEIRGEFDCASGTPRLSSLSMTDSRFPSDRIFVNGALTLTHPQDTLSRLWFADPLDSSRVE